MRASFDAKGMSSTGSEGADRLRLTGIRTSGTGLLDTTIVSLSTSISDSSCALELGTTACDFEAIALELGITLCFPAVVDAEVPMLACDAGGVSSEATSIEPPSHPLRFTKHLWHFFE